MEIPSITHEEITARAHALWEQEGRPEGREREHWLRAEAELQREREQSALVAGRISLKEGATASATDTTTVTRDEVRARGNPKRAGKTGARRRTDALGQQ
jgi:hypothetical protein